MDNKEQFPKIDDLTRRQWILRLGELVALAGVSGALPEFAAAFGQDQGRHDESKLADYCHFSIVGRLGRFLRPRQPTYLGHEWIWDSRPRSRDQPVRKTRIYRSSDLEP